MSAQAKQHLKHEALVGGVSNTVFNGLIAWWLLKEGAGCMAAVLVVPMVVSALRSPSAETAGCVSD